MAIQEKKFIPPDGHKCGVSHHIGDDLTFGTGKLSDNGFWEHPCYACARAWEQQFPEAGHCWPYTPEYIVELARDNLRCKAMYSITRADLKPAIRVWRFEDAPAELQALSTHGGDEDWVAFVPPEYKSHYLGWIESGTGFGCRDTQEEILPDGSRVFIGAHA